jgi:sugar fermentation stimulation protein A
MKFESKLIEGFFIKRYKRFFVDVNIGSLNKPNIVVAHNANTGTMATCIQENWKVLVSHHDSPNRKLKYSFEMINNGLTWIGINTSLTNKLANEAILNGTIKELQGYKLIKPEAKIGNSRIDFLLSKENESCYVEVKNVTLVEKNVAFFPDAVTERGQKHLAELISIKKSGSRAVMLFVIQREDCTEFSLESTIDKKYSALLLKAMNEGVEVLVYQCILNPEEIKIKKSLPFLK